MLIYFFFLAAEPNKISHLERDKICLYPRFWSLQDFFFSCGIVSYLLVLLRKMESAHCVLKTVERCMRE